jgi:hypothetical protein
MLLDSKREDQDYSMDTRNNGTAGDLEVGWRMVLKFILEKQGGVVWTELIWLGIETREGLT